MIKVVLDANQYVSLLLKHPSNPGRIFELAEEGRVTLFLSPLILEELKRVLSYPKLKSLHRRSPREIRRFLARLERVALTTPGALKVAVVQEDPSDDIYLACALEGQVDYIVSGDKHLLKLGKFQGIPIVKPASFLRIISEPGEP